MENIDDEFLTACGVNKIAKVKILMSKGADINVRDSEYGHTGLMLAMQEGYTDLARILLRCSSIRLDIRDNDEEDGGWTALHFACFNRQEECVKLFLAHPACTEEIVRIKSNNGHTAEDLAEDYRIHECARLVREFTANKKEKNRTVDDLVKFITGRTETEKKKRKKERKNLVQLITTHSESIVCSLSNDIKETICKEVPKKERNTIDVYKLKNQDKVKLEEKIAQNYVLFDAHEQKVKELIDVKSAQIKDLIFKIEKSQADENDKLSNMDKLDQEISDLEKKTAELKLKKTEFLEERKKVQRLIKKYKDEKNKIEDVLEKELKISNERGDAIRDDIFDLESKLVQTKKAMMPNNEPNEEFLKFLDAQIDEKEKELECPVCLEVACSPIFMCPEQHLICSTCKPKLSSCPECRVRYRGNLKRHRYAEKTADALERLKNKKDQVRK